MMKFMLSVTCLSLILSVACTQTIQKEGDAVVVIPADNSRLFWKWQGESGGSWGVQEGTREDLEEYREKFQEEMSDNPLGLGFGLGQDLINSVSWIRQKNCSSKSRNFRESLVDSRKFMRI